jgi:F-type H+-transporting ATPase subunit b
MAEPGKQKKRARQIVLTGAVIYVAIYVGMKLLGHLLSQFGEAGQMVGFTANLPIQMANLILLIWLLKVLLYRPLLSFMEERNNRIQRTIEEAQADREKGKAYVTETEQELARIRKESAAMLRGARQEAQSERTRLVTHAEKERTEILEDAQREIGLQVEKAKAELRGEVAELSVQIAQQVVSRSLSEEDLRRLAQESLAQMEQRSPLQ